MPETLEGILKAIHAYHGELESAAEDTVNGAEPSDDANQSSMITTKKGTQ